MKYQNFFFVNLMAFSVLTLGTIACTKQHSENSEAFERNKEAREDSVEYAMAIEAQSKVPHQVVPVMETAEVQAAVEDDAADDPAFWLNPNDPDSSIIFGSNKKGGIYAYNLQGTELNYYEVGLVNNIDITQGVSADGDTIDFLGGSSRTNNAILLFQIHHSGKLSEWGQITISTDKIDEVYGFCMYSGSGGEARAIVNGKNGVIHSYILEGEKLFNLENEWKVATQPEGMVVDTSENLLYIGEEQRGIWKVDIPSGQMELLKNSGSDNQNIRFDVEGLSIYQQGDSIKWLLASSQGNFSYAVFDLLDSAEYLGSFKVVGSDQIDGTEETDGIHVVNDSLSGYPKGLMIIQDGFNYSGSEPRPQNFKVISMEDVQRIWNQ